MTTQTSTIVDSNVTIPDDVTAPPTPAPLVSENLRIGFAVIESSMLIGSLYLFASLVFYVIKRRRKAINVSKTSKRRIYNGLLLLLVILYTVVTLVKFILAQAMLYNNNEINCGSFAKANRLLQITGFAILSLFLWFRQHQLYDMPQLRHLTAPAVKWWSRITLLMVIIAFVSGSAIIGIKQWSHDRMCVTSDTGLSPSALSGVISAVVVQGSLLTLFAVLVIKRRGDLPNTTLPSQLKRTKLLVTKCCVLAAVCAFTDVSSLVIVTLIKSFTSELVTILILDLDQFINLCCLLLCFATWRRMLLPWPCCVHCHLSDVTSGTPNSGAETTSVSRVISMTQNNAVGSSKGESTAPTPTDLTWNDDNHKAQDIL